jgi:hypothetical protein
MNRKFKFGRHGDAPRKHAQASPHGGVDNSADACLLQPSKIDHIVNHIVARVLDQFGISACFAKRWDGKMKTMSELKAEPTGTE